MAEVFFFKNIQEIGDVNAMKAAYLNDEQIVKADPDPGGRTWRKWWENTHREILKEQELRPWVLVTIRCSNTPAQEADDSKMM